MVEKNGAAARDRTVDLGINSPTLYQLSYSGLMLTILVLYKNLSLGADRMRRDLHGDYCLRRVAHIDSARATTKFRELSTSRMYSS